LTVVANQGQPGLVRIGKALPSFSLLLVTGGLCLIGWLAWNLIAPAPAPYAYVQVGSGTTEAFPDLAADPGVTVERYELRAEGAARPLVVMHTATPEGAAPVLLDWQADFSEPLIHLATDIGETNTLAQAVKQHAPGDALLLAWWDLSRRLRLLTGHEALFDRNLDRPLLLPEAWERYRSAIERLENAFWGTEETLAERRSFDRYVDAMLAEKASGSAKLRALTGGREAYLIVDIRDAYKLGNLYPDRFGIGFKDFPKGGDVHGSASSIKNWLREQGYTSYAIQPVGHNLLRVYFFTDKTSQETLLASLLPFTSSNPVELEEIDLVYQHKGYWVYRLSSGKEEAWPAAP
jgi:hydroxylamine oxidation protein HaoB